MKPDSIFKGERRGRTKKYRTRQRDAILRFLRENPAACPSAAEVCAALTRGGASVGRTTVYRTLEALVKSGELLAIPAQDKSGVRYQLRSDACARENHIHLKCERCGSVLHLDCDLVRRFSAHLLEVHGFRIDRGKTIIYGLCGDCARECGDE